MVYILIDELGHEIDRSKNKDKIDKALLKNPGGRIITYLKEE